MSRGNFSESVHIVPLMEPKDVASSTVQTDVFSCREHWIEVLIPIGAITGNATVYVKGCNNTTATGTAVATWWYRKTSALGTDSIGAITAGSASGITITDGTDENKVMVIDIDPDQFGAVPYVYAFVEIVGGGVLLASAVGLFFPRYPQNVQVSEVV